MAGCYEYGDEPAASGTMELVGYICYSDMVLNINFSRIMWSSHIIHQNIVTDSAV
jgi:hypothetical protein